MRLRCTSFLLYSVASFRNTWQCYRQLPMDANLAEESLGRGPLGGRYSTVGAEIAVNGWKNEDGVRTSTPSAYRYKSHVGIGAEFQSPGPSRVTASSRNGSLWVKYSALIAQYSANISRFAIPCRLFLRSTQMNQSLFSCTSLLFAGRQPPHPSKVARYTSPFLPPLNWLRRLHHVLMQTRLLLLSPLVH